MNLLSQKQYTNQPGYENSRSGRTASCRRLFTHLSPSGLAQRLVLTLAVLLAGANATWGQTEQSITIDKDNKKITRSQLEGHPDGTILELSFQNESGSDRNGWGNGWVGKDVDGLKFIGGSGTGWEQEFSVSKILSEVPSGDISYDWYNNCPVTSGKLIIPVVDPFLNVPADVCTLTSNEPGFEIGRDEISKDNITLAGASLDNVKYARIFLADAKGKAVDPTGLLSVKYGGNDATQATTDAKNGFYLYNNGSDLTLSDIQVTLNAGAGNFTKYKIVALLSSDLSTATISAGSIGKEPKWQEEYTYSFKYPIYEKLVSLGSDDVSGSEIEIDDNGKYRDEILSYYGKTAAQIKDVWYGRWYITDGSGVQQNLSLGTSAGTGWVITPRKENENWNTYSWSTSDGKIAYTTDEGRKNEWFVNQALCRIKVYAPNSSLLEDYAGYQIVFETTDSYTGGTPVFTVRYVFVIPPKDLFLNTAKSGVVTGSGSAEKNKTTDAYGDFTLSAANSVTGFTNIANVKYARIYVTDASGKKLDYDTKADGSNNLLEVTEGQVAGTSKKNGLYVYNGGSNLDLSGITVKLNAGVGNLKKYKVVALLSADAATTDGSNVTKEPQWDYEYTYTFTYPVSIDEVKETLDESVLEGQYVNLTKKGDIVSYFGKTDNTFCTSWYARWYVTNESGVKQTIESNKNMSSNWTVTNYQNDNNDWPTENWQVSDNAVYCSSKVQNQDWYISQVFARNTRIAAPNGTTFEDYSGYKIVLEVTDEYDGGDPEIKVRYIFTIPSADPFLGVAKGTVTSGTGSQEVEKTATSGSFTLNGVYSNDIKYARIILCDEDGKALADQSKLVVTYNGVAAVAAGSKTKNGVYIYNNGNTLDKSKISVTLNAGLGNMTKYRIKCLLAEDAATDISTKEPDWDYEYTYKFSYPTRGTFTALNINDVKTKYKTELYDATSRSATIHLLSNWYEVAGDCDASKQELADNGYVRWYLTDAEGNLLTIKNLTSSDAYTSLGNDYGYWRKGFNVGNFREGGDITGNGDYAGYNPTITIPDGVDYKNVRIVCVATTLLDEMDMSIPQEPESLQVKYVYSLMTQDELNSAPFVHYIGESHRSYKIVDGIPGDTQKSWSHLTGLVDETTYASQNIRQNVHQTDYYVYINKSNPNPDKLMLTLPIEHWAVANSSGKRSSTEPLAYFRWYDWNTDMKTEYLDVLNTEKTKLSSRSDNRGLMALMLSGSSDEIYRNEIGVKLNPAGIAALDANKEILIACDISRYMDGIMLTTTDNKNYTPYLVHEPTLSMRYLFHILPSTVIADNIDAGASTLKSVEAKLAEGKNYWKNDEISKVERVQMFQTYEDNGRVVVSLNGTTGKFAMRAALQELNQYFINSGDITVQCSNIQWYSYYEDDEGLWKMKVTMNKTGENPEARNTVRLAKYETTDFNGTYTKVGSTETKTVTVGNGTQLHLIGCLGNGTVEQAVVHYGLEFLDEKPEKLGTESAHRTDDFMYQNLTHGKTLDFNDFFVNPETRFDKPLTSYENYAKIPLAWEYAQYGFCYPQLYGQCASNWQIHHGGWWEGYGIAPTHSDYTLLKTMNVPGVSASQTFENQAIYTFWYDENTEAPRRLYDVTHERLDMSKSGNDAKYGTYLYIDASDEARTFAQLEFTASLCAGSEIYYTAYVANMTSQSQTPPQVMFRVSTDITEGGVTKRVPVVSFLTGDIKSEDADHKTGVWYQVYGYTKIPKEFENQIDGTTERTYYVSIDNYSENTDGADYAVDQISFFTSSATVQVTQSSTPCDESSGVEVTIMAPADELINVVGRNETKTLYYRLFEKSSDPNHVLSAQDAVSGPYKNDIETYANVYGSVEFRASYNKTELENDNVYDQPKEGTTGFYISSENGKVYYQFDKREFNLKMGKKYFVSFLEIGKTAAGAQDLTDWGSPYGGKICSTVFSNDIEPRLLRIDLESGGVPSDGSIELGCGVTSVPKSFLITVEYPTIDGYNQHTDVMFDFYHDTKAKFKAVKNTNGLYLERALEHMRLTYPGAYTSSSELPTEYITTEGKEYNAEMRALIAEYMNNGMLDLSSTRTFNYTFTTADAGEKKFAAIPVSRLTSDGYICSPLEFVFDVDANSNGPKMDLGFADVTYPADYKRVVRVGLEQLNKMKTEQYKLHIPVNSFENKGAGKDRKLHFSNPYLYLVSTDDPTIDVENATDPIVVAKIFDPKGGSNKTDVYVNTTRMYLPLDFSGDNCKVNFHEGYKYEVSTSFYDEEEESLSESSRCIGDLYLVFKVVPKYVTWNAQQLNATQWSGNWYNDDNWNRSVRSELYKDTGQNTDGYENNGEGSLSGLSATSNPGFMPMKFTYVTMLSNNHSPSLVSESTNSAPKIVGTPQTGGDLINPSNELGSDTSPSGGSSYPKEEDRATIRFDMLVRYGTHAKGGEGCFGHQTMSNSGGSWGWNTFDPTTFTENAKAYDCEKFYGNVCKEIYFKPGAELRLQQRLEYEKAWVEEELEPNKWYLMSTPLKGTYAGDMYVPATAITDYSLATPATVVGRQVTEAFQPITFNQSKGYSRTQYPFYQRSWGPQSSKVYTKTDDVRTTDYSAYIKYPGVSANQIEWSHTYNDVQVPYSSFSGFAIRANRKTMTDKALIRLPKADTSYDYYDWTDTSSTPAAGASVKSVTKGNGVYGRLVFDNQDNAAGGYTSADLEEWDIPLSKLQAQGTDEEGYTYYLVGNPFMASIDMGVFFYNANRGEEYNPLLDPVYYTYEDGVLQATDARTTAKVIRPLQAFVVRCRAAEKPEKVVFHRRAITDGNYTPATLYVPANNTGGARRLTLKASGSGGSSTASVAVDSQASDGYDHTEDAMTLFDSNLSDVPVVFTITDGRAVSIDSRQSLGVVPFGVACAGSNELVSVECSFSHQTSDVSQLYVVDAVTGGVTEVGEGGSVMVQPNDYGRYFLTTRSDLTALKGAKADGGIVVSVRGSLVTVKAGEALTSVRALTTGGATVYSEADCGPEMSFRLNQGGVYIIEAQTAEARKTVKIVVKN